MNRQARSALLWPVLLLLFLLPPPVGSQSPVGEGPEAVLQQAARLLARAEEDRSALQTAVDLLERAAVEYPEDHRIPLALAESWYRMADPEGEIDLTWPIYEKTERYAEESLQLEPGRPETRYWYGLSQLKRAQKTGGVRAYFAARRGVRELEEVHRQMPRYDQAGAARVLSLLYTVAPGWSPFGDLKKAIHYGQQAVRFAPGYPLNRLYLARAYEKAGMPAEAAGQYRQVLEQGGKFEGEAKRKLEEIEERDAE